MVVMAMRSRSVLLSAAFLLGLCAGPVSWAEDAVPTTPAPASASSAPASAATAPRRMLVAFQKSLFAGYSDEEVRIIERAFVTRLSDADGGPEPVETDPRAFPSSLQDRNKAARDAAADCWLWVGISGLRGRPSLRVQSFDLLYNVMSIDASFPRSEAFSVMDLYRERWDDIIPLLVKKYPPLSAPAYTRGPPGNATLRIRALPGTEITGLSQKPLVVGPDGTASIEVPSPAPYSFRATRGGYIPRNMTIYFDRQSEIVVPQERSPWFSVDAAFLDGFFPGVSATFSGLPFPGFARLGFTTFRAGISTNNDQVFTSLPLSQLTLLLGFYVSPEDSETRFYVGLGPVLRLSLPPGGTLTVDNLIPFGAQIVAGWELPLAGNLHSFFELAPSGYYVSQPTLFQYTFGQNNGTFPYFLVDKIALNLFEMRFGLRLKI